MSAVGSGCPNDLIEAVLFLLLLDQSERLEYIHWYIYVYSQHSFALLCFWFSPGSDCPVSSINNVVSSFSWIL